MQYLLLKNGEGIFAMNVFYISQHSYTMFCKCIGEERRMFKRFQPVTNCHQFLLFSSTQGVDWVGGCLGGLMKEQLIRVKANLALKMLGRRRHQLVDGFENEVDILIMFADLPFQLI